MNELNGLRAIAETTGTIHSLEPPPDRADFLSYEEYDEAYEAWYWRVCAWSSSSVEPPK